MTQGNDDMSAQTDLATVLAYEAGVREGMERAAKIADTEAAIGTCDRPTARQIAKKIRAAKE